MLLVDGGDWDVHRVHDRKLEEIIDEDRYEGSRSHMKEGQSFSPMKPLQQDFTQPRH